MASGGSGRRTWPRSQSTSTGLFIRCYLDQGKPHPAQMQGHRTTTTLHPIQSFNARKKPYPSMLALASDNTLPLK